MFDFLDDVFEGISSWFNSGSDALGDVFGDGGFSDARDMVDTASDGGSSWLGKVGSAALGAGVNVMKGGLGSRTGNVGRISSGISVDRMGNERPRQAEGPNPLTSANPQTIGDMWVNRMREFARMNQAIGGKADATK